MGQREVEDSYLRGAILEAVTVSPKAALLGVSRKAAGCLQGGRPQGRGKGRTNGQECQGHGREKVQEMIHERQSRLNVGTEG